MPCRCLLLLVGSSSCHSYLACLDSGIDSRGKRIGVFSAGTNTEAFELVRIYAVQTTTIALAWSR
jgi:hypothetical protein